MITVGQKVNGVTDPEAHPDLNDMATMEVMATQGDMVQVKVTDHEYEGSMVGELHWVFSSDLQGGESGSSGHTQTFASAPTPSGSEIDNAILIGAI